MNTEHVLDVDEAEFQSRVVDASRQAPVVVDFWAGWCQPCLVLSPTLERLAQEYRGRFTLAKVDVDTNPELAARYRVQGIPAVKAFVDGAVASEFVGVQPEDLVRRFIDQVVPSEADSHPAQAECKTDCRRACRLRLPTFLLMRLLPCCAIGFSERRLHKTKPTKSWRL
jgi:putative thioredoxin